MELNKILEAVRDGSISVNEAEKTIQYLPYEELEYAVIDYQRELRNGCPEVIFCQGKSYQQINGIVENMKEHDVPNILATRASVEAYEAIKSVYDDAKYYDMAKLVVVQRKAFVKNKGKILVISAGTADIPISEEAAITAEFLGNNVERMYDVGVAGLHRLLSKLDKIKEANVIVVVAGMEGALASVVGGLTDKPVVAVPTSIGYGANFAGLSALLCMLNSCASGVSVVNIDNGFGAGYAANNINKLSGKVVNV